MLTVIRKAPPVMVDEAIFPYRGTLYCHMFCSDLDRLHSMATAIGLRREWFQEPPKASWPHYDLSPGKRRFAISLGAVPVDRYEAVLFDRRRRNVPTGGFDAMVDEIRQRRAR